MKSWKMRLLMVFAMLALVLAVSVPGMADVQVSCDAEDGGSCEKTITYDSEAVEDPGTGLEGETADDPFAVEPPPAVETADDCYPFCGLEWWPW